MELGVRQGHLDRDKFVSKTFEGVGLDAQGQGARPERHDGGGAPKHTSQ